MTYARKVDTNHAAIRDGLRQVFGPAAVQDVSMYRGLGFDLIVYAGGAIAFLEVKPPRKVTHLTESEQAARERYGNIWRVVTTLEDALEALR